jgi:hypothetical protein
LGAGASKLLFPGAPTAEIKIIDISIVGEIREATELLLDIPNKLVQMVANPQITFYETKERIRRYREIAELREIGKCLQSLYFRKGELLADWATTVDKTEDVEATKHILSTFEGILYQLNEINKIISDATFSNTSLATEAILTLKRAQLVYGQLMKCSPQEILDGHHLPEIMGFIDRLLDAGSTLIQRLDQERKLLDHTYG